MNLIDGNELNINPKYTFEEFIVGPNNRFTHAAGLAVAENPGKVYNPFFIYGGVGLGKTHLMQAIGHLAMKKFPGLKIFYIPAEKFVSAVINSISKGKITELRESYQAIDLLLVDDAQFLAESESTQDEFFHIFNLLHQSNKQIILTSDRPPKLLTTLEDRLRSRFEWGLIADIKSPSLETRVAILKKKGEHENLSLDDNILLYIASKLKSNIRELEGFLKRINAYAAINNTPVDMALVKDIMQELLPDEDEPIPQQKQVTAPARPAQQQPQQQQQQQQQVYQQPQQQQQQQQVYQQPQQQQQQQQVYQQPQQQQQQQQPVYQQPQQQQQQQQPVYQQPQQQQQQQPVYQQPPQQQQQQQQQVYQQPQQQQQQQQVYQQPQQQQQQQVYQQPQQQQPEAQPKVYSVQKQQAFDPNSLKPPLEHTPPPPPAQTAAPAEIDTSLKSVEVCFFYPEKRENELNNVKDKFRETIKKHNLKFRLESVFDKSYDYHNPKINFQMFTELCKSNKINIMITVGPPPDGTIGNEEFINTLSVLADNEHVFLQFIPWTDLGKDYRYLNLALDITLIKHKTSF